MRNKNPLLGLICLMFLVVALSMSTRSQKPLEEADFEVIEIGTGGAPHWSPDGTKLAYVYKNALYIANAEGTGERLKVAELPKWTSGFVWIDSTEFIFNEFERHRIKGKGKEERRSIKKLTIDGKIEPIVEAQIHKGDPMITPPMVLNDGTVGYYEIPVSEGRVLEEEKIFRMIRLGKLPPDSALKQIRTIPDHQLGISKKKEVLDSPVGIWLESVDGTIRRQICKDKTYAYRSPQLSPDGTKILAENPYGHGMWVLGLDGKELAYVDGDHLRDSVVFAPGIVGWAVGVSAKWSPDSKQIVYMVSAEDGHTVITTDLFLINVDGTGRIRLTNTPDIIEAYPIWSPDGSRIAYVTDIGSKIYVMRMK